MIKKSRDVQKAAKQAIYALQRGELSKAKGLLEACERMLRSELLPLAGNEPELREGSLSACIEEYAEAKIFDAFVRNPAAAIPVGLSAFPSDIVLKPDEYLGGVMDCTGEVQRFAIVMATRGDLTVAEFARDFVDFVMGRVMRFDLRK